MREHPDSHTRHDLKPSLQGQEGVCQSLEQDTLPIVAIDVNLIGQLKPGYRFKWDKKILLKAMQMFLGMWYKMPLNISRDDFLKKSPKPWYTAKFCLLFCRMKRASATCSGWRRKSIPQLSKNSCAKGICFKIFIYSVRFDSENNVTSVLMRWNMKMCRHLIPLPL